MRKVFFTAALLFIGIVAPILACSDNSCKTEAPVLAMPAEVIGQEETDTPAIRSQVPWLDNKNLSDKDINDIMKQSKESLGH
ncbi:MAG TPA: hypothetical protein VD993_13845 [Chitinophagaceae bacterium]|nr:hypothetical protein [Chitinophagaceae bacterium]